MKIKYDRYINNRVLIGMVRPQWENECAINSIAGALNSISNRQLRRGDIYKLTGWDKAAVINGKMDNDDIVGALEKGLHLMGLSGTAKFHRRVFADEETSWRLFKKSVRKGGNVLIYHAEGHYCLIAGYLEEPLENNHADMKGYRKRRDWIVIADHDYDVEPIRMLQWADARRECTTDREFGVITLSVRG